MNHLRPDNLFDARIAVPPPDHMEQADPTDRREHGDRRALPERGGLPLAVRFGLACAGALALAGPAGAADAPDWTTFSAERPGGFADRLFVLTTDYATGSSSTVGLLSPWNTQLDVEPVGADPVARYAFGLLYVVNRLGGDNLQVIDPATNATLHQHSVGSGANPQDVSVLSPTRAYLSLYNSTDLIEMNPITGEILDRIDLSVFADSDGLPEAARLHFDDPYMYVQIQRLDRGQFYEPVGDSYLAVIDTRNNSLVDPDPDESGLPGIALTATTNPFGPMELDLRTGRHLLVPCPGSYVSQADGGLERVDLDAWTSDGLVMSGSDLGGDLVDLCAYEGDTMFAIVSNSSFVTCLVELDLAAGSVGSTLYCSDGFDLADCAYASEGWLYVADRSFDDPGVRVFNAASGAQASGPVYVGLPPVELHVLRPATSDAPIPESHLPAQIRPNPSDGRVSWTLAQETSSHPLRIVDAKGRVVRMLPADARSWDGRDDAGRSVAAGAYWMSVQDSHGTPAVPFRIVR
ncbi:MAG: FlgD immunoglobulin-like domain containing protein [Candidatus Eisenbacteria bacterium]